MTLFALATDALALGSLASSLLVVTARNPVVAVLFLIATFVNAAGYLLLMGVGFVGLAYVIVYIGAIAVLFLFVVMMIDVKLADVVEVGTGYTRHAPLGALLGLLVAYVGLRATTATAVLPSPVGIALVWGRTWFGSETPVAPLGGGAVADDLAWASVLHVQALGQLLYTQGAVWLLTVGVVLLLSMVAPLFVSRR